MWEKQKSLTKGLYLYYEIKKMVITYSSISSISSILGI